jgi:hypothetical protein
VDLRDRRGRQRCLVDLREWIVGEIFGDDAPDLLERNGRDLVDELPELLDVDVRQEVGPGRQELAELDERRTELLESLSELARAFLRRRAAADDSELAEDAQQAAAPRDTRHGHSPSRSLEAFGHDEHLSNVAPAATASGRELDRGLATAGLTRAGTPRTPPPAQEQPRSCR